MLAHHRKKYAIAAGFVRQGQNNFEVRAFAGREVARRRLARPIDGQSAGLRIEDLVAQCVPPGNRKGLARLVDQIKRSSHPPSAIQNYRDVFEFDHGRSFQRSAISNQLSAKSSAAES
jgi:hypothetical protein